MDLLITSIVLLGLFFATYSQRRTWITLGSATLSIALITGFVFLSTAEESNPVRDGLTRLAMKLPSGWDQRALDLANAIEQASVASAAARKRAAERAPEPILAASISDWFSWGSWSKTETETKTEPEAGPEPEPASEASADVPIKWLLDEPATNETFALSGTNVSDQSLRDVQAVLKPDSGKGELALALDLEGRNGGAVIPPGARFSLAAATLTKADAKELGGAVLSVSYVQDGKRRASIMYLSPPTIAALTANN